MNQKMNVNVNLRHIINVNFTKEISTNCVKMLHFFVLIFT